MLKTNFSLAGFVNLGVSQVQVNKYVHVPMTVSENCHTSFKNPFIQVRHKTGLACGGLTYCNTNNTWKADFFHNVPFMVL